MPQSVCSPLNPLLGIFAYPPSSGMRHEGGRTKLLADSH